MPAVANKAAHDRTFAFSDKALAPLPTALILGPIWGNCSTAPTMPTVIIASIAELQLVPISRSDLTALLGFNGFRLLGLASISLSMFTSILVAPSEPTPAPLTFDTDLVGMLPVRSGTRLLLVLSSAPLRKFSGPETLTAASIGVSWASISSSDTKPGGPPDTLYSTSRSGSKAGP